MSRLLGLAHEIPNALVERSVDDHIGRAILSPGVVERRPFVKVGRSLEVHLMRLVGHFKISTRKSLRGKVGRLMSEPVRQYAQAACGRASQEPPSCISNDPPTCLASMPRSNSQLDLSRGDGAKPAEGSAGRRAGVFRGAGGRDGVLD
ncbi:hypothetical protein [Bradyrhizobium elkanii]|uniref:hypothetical protein n=1 Tax=Bradyrhizobium elkanii TaxID=29448 RepID=UPI0012FE398A|nr:hypothetical protein [Bradyrhizobium elkanii]WLA79951.1 hypothetical protein QNJ99_31815 [Bradyrhizobium elkanii]